MKLFYQYPQPDVKEIHEITSKVYGIEHPERINGYEGTFLFHVPDVYISDEISQRIDINLWFADRLKDMLKRFCNDDYGFVTRWEGDCNGETRYFSFSSSWMIGRYGSELGGIVFETFYDMSLFYFVEENVSLIWQQQDMKRRDYCRSKGYNYEPGNTGNQLRFEP